ncbi:hypothetical protein SAMN04488542_1024 [Fontibacillus panacisegetis]|uniref:Uncharacterized protein n=1 Tax=Fontibacillus panacisegetis TaxID=670482 RepID=A0A1G7FI58_9BACL|nr:hypothetical protein [Fontibacillus panacisegetis]SDE75626.1 hypothetical protein SAMN04488542_1024 [Fontibacillus panacisegetis]
MMDDKLIPIEYFNKIIVDSMVFLAVFLVGSLILKHFKFNSDLFERAISALKATGYALLAAGAYFLTYENGGLVAAWPQSLSLSQCFLIFLGAFEAVSNFVAVFKFRNSDD